MPSFKRPARINPPSRRAGTRRWHGPKSLKCAALGLVLLLTVGGAQAIMPYGLPNPANPDDYASYLFINSGDCSQGDKSVNNLPSNFDCVSDWKDSDYRDTSHFELLDNPQEFYGVEGPGVNKAWEVTTGRPDVLISVIDSGVEWTNPSAVKALVNKWYLNRGELPKPICANGQTGNPKDTRYGGYDCNGDGVFNAADYSHDPRVHDLNGNGVIDPEDLIRTFSDGVDNDHNGYVDDIAGWDFLENDNDPFDDVSYGHGTGEEKDSSGEAGTSSFGRCPNCMVVMLRVGQSFIANMNNYAQAVTYAVDNHVSVIQEALGVLNHTSFGDQANKYAYEHGVPIIASEADEGAAHHNWPAAAGHDMVVNAIRNPSLPTNLPYSYLYLDGCTNFGGYTFVSIPATSCSSEATGRSSGMTGLLVSAARNAVDRGKMTDYIRDDGSQAPYPLSAEEIYQLWRLSASDIDFSTPCPQHAGCNDSPSGVPGVALPNNYLTTFPIPSQRYRSVRGWDYFTGYGRANASKLVRFIGRDGDPSRTYGPTGLTAQDRIPPEARIESPKWWTQYAYKPDDTLLRPDDPLDPSDVVVRGHVAANRVTSAGGSFDWVLEWAPGAQAEAWPGGQNPAPGSQELSGGPWTVAASGHDLTQAYNGELGRIPIASIVAAQAVYTYPFKFDPTSPFKPEQYGVRIRLRVIAHPTNPKDTVNNEAVFQKQIDVYPAAEEVLRTNLGVRGLRGGASGSPSFHDLNGDGRDELILPTDDGLVHAYTNVATGQELPGWPVHTRPIPLPTTGHNAYTDGAMQGPWYDGIIGGSAAVADLDGNGTEYVIVGDLRGYIYAWGPDGKLKPGFPVHVDFNITHQTPCGPSTIPNCDANEPGGPKVDQYNRRISAISFAPSVGKIDKNYPGLDIIAASGDGHIYAWHADGTSVPGWPVVLKDPTKVASMAPGTQFVTYTSDANPLQQGKAIVTPSIGDINGSGFNDVVVGVNEEYKADVDAGLITGTLSSLAAQLGILDGGNTRLYAIHHDGTLHSRTASDVNADCAGSPHTECQAYLKGWPVKMALIDTELLPYVGDGTDAPAVLADLNGDGIPEIIDASAAGPGYIFNGDGSDYLGTLNGKQQNLSVTPLSPTTGTIDTPAFVAAGGLSIGSLDGGNSLTVAGATAGLQRVLNLTLEAHQILGQDQLALWNAQTGAYELGAPVQINDLQFFVQPTIADVTGDGKADVIQSSAVNDTIVVSKTVLGTQTTRYHSGGWTVSAAAVGAAPIGDGQPKTLSFATTTREGYLHVYPTPVKIDGSENCKALSQWPEYQHDAFNSGNYDTDATPPYPLTQVTAQSDATDQVVFKFTASGDSRDCGKADHYELREAQGSDDDWNQAKKIADYAVTANPGQPDGFTTQAQPEGAHTYLLRVFDKAGNGSPVSVMQVSVGGGSSSGGSSSGGSSSGASSSGGGSSSGSGSTSGGSTSGGSTSGGSTSGGSTSGGSTSGGSTSGGSTSGGSTSGGSTSGGSTSGGSTSGGGNSSGGSSPGKKSGGGAPTPLLLLGLTLLAAVRRRQRATVR